MSRIHPLLLLTALPLVACSSDDDGGPPEGDIHSYVVSEGSLPTSNQQAVEFGLDLNGDNVVDNQLGSVLAALVSQGFDVQDAIKDAIDQGDIILLMDLQTTSFSSASRSGLQVHLSDKTSAMPAPCTDSADTTCRKHLDGNGSFAIATGSPNNAAVTGKVVGGTFNGGPGNISIKIALGGPDGVQLNLIGARAKASGMTEAGLDSVIVAGALPEEDLKTQVIPAIHSQLVPIITAECPMPQDADCGCPSGTARTILNLFDTAPKDCMVSVQEIADNTLIKSLLAPDVTIDGQKALSLGIKVKATKATIRK
jgi:hypothetical protein